jgi:arylsulfatase A-like enzyme
MAGLKTEALLELLDTTSTVMDLAGLPIPKYMQGKSLLPILRGEASPDDHRDFVRSEYFDALAPEFTGGNGAFATMYRDRRYKLIVYHGHKLGELYDLETDPWEHENLWDCPKYVGLKYELLHASLDATVLLTTDIGSRRIAPM